jgi:hypothetical protein
MVTTWPPRWGFSNAPLQLVFPVIADLDGGPGVGLCLPAFQPVIGEFSGLRSSSWGGGHADLSPVSAPGTGHAAMLRTGPLVKRRYGCYVSGRR